MKKIIFSLILLCTLAFSSCNSLDVAPPNSITDEQITELLKDSTKVSLIMSALAANLPNYFNISGKTYTGYSSYPLNSQIDQDFVMSMLGNDVVLGSLNITSGGHASYYALTTAFNLADNDFPFWALPSDIITGANKVLNYLSDDATVSASKTLQDYRARCLTLRGYGYFQLMQRFQKAYTNGGSAGKGMPLYTSYGVNTPAAISSAKETYEFILKDLKEAVSLFESSGVGYTKSDVTDIDEGVAQYLLARAALCYGDWTTAISACTSLIAKYPSFITEANYGAKDDDFAAICAGTKEVNASDNAFHCIAANPETILGFANGSTNNNQYFYIFSNIFSPGEAGYGSYYPCIDSKLYNKIDSRDFRKANYTTTTGNYTYIYDSSKHTQTNTIPQYANMKFGATLSLASTARDNNTYCDDILIRASEVYLMLAEAYAQSGQDTMAKSTLNTLLAARTKSGSTTLTCDNYTGMSGMTALQMVELQWRIEMWLEKGLEFYNNKRWNVAVDRSGSANHYSNNTTFSVDEMTLEIPTAEQTANSNWAK